METNKRKDTLSEEELAAMKDLPGAAIDKADKEKANPDLVRERTSTLNNNPRNDYPVDD